MVAFPTETVYGLGADATRGEAVARIYEAKKRPSFNPLIAHLHSFDAALGHGVFDENAIKLASAFWPGPLTLVVPLAKTSAICELARAGLPSIGLRVPAHPIAQNLLRLVGRPIAAPSANRSGRLSPCRAEDVLADLDGHIDAVLDGGTAEVGVESTIVACIDPVPRLLRPGGVEREMVKAVLGGTLADARAGIIAPGMLQAHYAPATTLRMNARTIARGEAVLLFGSTHPAGIDRAMSVLDLSPRGDLREASANLFTYLRELDRVGAKTIAVVPIPQPGLGEAINDRLSRAARGGFELR
jgi:L-threonylcarbamoyladenylate synthase